MIPIHQLLSRIRWDKEFGQAHFELAYLDRFTETLCIVPFEAVTFPENQPHLFTVVDDTGETHTVPFHRVREVRRNGAVIWQRPER